MKPATEIPLQTAAAAIEIAEMAIVMVERGFTAALGESQSALLAALAAADGAICVTRFNIATIAGKINKLNDPGYERPWLSKMTRRADDLAEIAAGHHNRERVLRERQNARLPRQRRRRKNSTAT